MEWARVDGVELAYEVHGSGEPVVLIHWGVGAGWAEPLLREPSLAGRYRLLDYHRAGFGRSGPMDGPGGMDRHAAHCAALMRHVGIDQAHVVGHSSSAAVALQLALDDPDVVHTLALMEPARPAPQTEVQGEFLRACAEPAIARYRAGDVEAAVDTWCEGVFGPGYRPALDAGLPGAFDQAVADAGAFFTQELPALRAWSFTEADAARVTQPALVVVGERSVPTFPERRDLLVSWLPDARPFDLPGATHLLHGDNPGAVAGALAAFFAAHPLAAPVG
jgi:pimeloyl-ACP methyl ester carboxylesterase